MRWLSRFGLVLCFLLVGAPALAENSTMFAEEVECGLTNHSATQSTTARVNVFYGAWGRDGGSKTCDLGPEQSCYLEFAKPHAVFAWCTAEVLSGATEVTGWQNANRDAFTYAQNILRVHGSSFDQAPAVLLGDGVVASSGMRRVPARDTSSTSAP